MNVFKILLSSVLFLIVVFTSEAQELQSTKEFGFNKAALKQAYLQDGLSEKEAEESLQRAIRAFETYHKRKAEKEALVLANEKTSKPNNAQQRMIADSCTNIGFENGNFDGWCRETGFFQFYDSQDGYLKIYNNDEICTNDPINDDVVFLIGNDSTAQLYECYDLRFELVQSTDTDPVGGIDLSLMEGDYAAKIGNKCVRNRLDRIEQTFIVTDENKVFGYNYAVALQDTGTCSHITFEDPEDPFNTSGLSAAECVADIPNPAHDILRHTKPYFTVYLEADSEKIECSEYLVFGDSRIFDFEEIDGGDLGNDIFVKNWAKNYIDLLRFVNLGDEVTVVAETADCGLGGHFGYAYFEGSCEATLADISATASNENACVDETINFTSTGGFGDYFWTIYDNNNGDVLATSFDQNTSYTFTEPGYYRITYGLPTTGTTGEFCASDQVTLYVDVEHCGNTPDACDGCDSFSPTPGKTYWLAAWVKEEHQEQVMSYNLGAIDLVFSDNNNQPVAAPLRLTTSGDIIEGWQRIIGEFTIPADAIHLNLNLINLSDSIPVYFDDVRVHPFNGNMKSFVYDPQNFRLMGELDENNYTTYYEYDNEGGLIRVKKETTQGVMTIQETRSNSPKKN